MYPVGQVAEASCAKQSGVDGQHGSTQKFVDEHVVEPQLIVVEPELLVLPPELVVDDVEEEDDGSGSGSPDDDGGRPLLLPLDPGVVDVWRDTPSVPKGSRLPGPPVQATTRAIDEEPMASAAKRARRD